jgi:signal transduction histidine kinase
MVSHDLRTPLSSIRVFHSSLQEGVYGTISERGKESLTLIESEVERLINMVNDLLNMEKLESGKLELDLASVDVDAFMRRSANAVSNLAAGKHIQLNVAGLGESCSIQADEERLLQVMINLLGNAIKFADEGSSIDLTAHRADGSLELQVCDRNRTIPEDLRVSIFDRFRQVELADSKSNKGMGLGLAICKAIVERHGGTIGVCERDGGGNIFWFIVPLVVGGGVTGSIVTAGVSPLEQAKTE